MNSTPTFTLKKKATKCRILIDKQIYPREKKYLIAMKRILTEEEYKKLNKRPRYCNRCSKSRRKWRGLNDRKYRYKSQKTWIINELELRTIQEKERWLWQ